MLSNLTLLNGTRQLTVPADPVQFKIVCEVRLFKRVLWFFCLVVGALVPQVGRADLLFQYPAGMSAAQVEVFSAAMSDALGRKVLATAERMSASEAPQRLPLEITKQLAEAESAYKQLSLSDVSRFLEGIETACMRAASFEVCRSAIFEADMLRGMSAMAAGQKDEANLAFQNAHIVFPSKIPDPRKYSPSILRAFAVSCTELESHPRLRLHVEAIPKQARIVIDGVPARTADVDVFPGRHIVQTDLAGFDEAVNLITVRGEETLQVSLAPKRDPEAWDALQNLLRRSSHPGDDPALVLLMTRFRIEGAVLAEKAQTESRLKLRLAVPGEAEFVTLPDLPSDSDGPTAAFISALRIAFGTDAVVGPILPPSSPGTTPSEVLTETESIEDDAEISDEEEDGDEEPSIQYSPDRAEAPAKKKNILKSPWFWISLAAVTAVVSGVVVGVQLGR